MKSKNATVNNALISGGMDKKEFPRKQKKAKNAKGQIVLNVRKPSCAK